MSRQILDAGAKWMFTQNTTTGFSIRSEKREKREKPRCALLHYDDKAWNGRVRVMSEGTSSCDDNDGYCDEGGMYG